MCCHNYWYLLGDTHGILALTDERLFVILSLWSDRDELKCVGSGTELSVYWVHCATGAVSQVDTTNGTLVGRENNTRVSVQSIWSHLCISFCRQLVLLYDNSLTQYCGKSIITNQWHQGGTECFFCFFPFRYEKVDMLQ